MTDRTLLMRKTIFTESANLAGSPVRVEGVVTHPSSLSEPCVKLSPHTAPMTCGLKPTAKDRKSIDCLYLVWF